jgi:predicted alpha-1,6-mannanase (GH76 family)
LVNWLNDKLLHPQRGVYQDGLRIRNGGTFLEEAVYTYNQGPILGALLELGGSENLERAAHLVEAVSKELTVPGTRVIHGDGTGDGGLCTGILVRYLALAARDQRLPADARETARDLVHTTAAAFWTSGREAPELMRGKGGTPWIFSPNPLRPASETYPPGAVVELSTQLQAWMTFEAAATLTPPNSQ